MGTGDQDADWSLDTVTNGWRRARMRWRAQPLAVQGIPMCACSQLGLANSLLRWSSMQHPPPASSLPMPATSTPTGTSSPDLPVCCPHRPIPGHAAHPLPVGLRVPALPCGTHSSRYAPTKTHQDKDTPRGHTFTPCHPSQTLPGPGCGCAQFPALPALLGPQGLPGEPWPHLPAPHCSHGD